jgi:hypothetical protein
MAKFETGNSGGGRTIGAENKKLSFSREATIKAIENIERFVMDGDFEASVELLSRTNPPLKPVTQKGTLEAKIIKAQLLSLASGISPPTK